MDVGKERPRKFVRDVEHYSVTVPLLEAECFLAYDTDQTLWAYTAPPRWSPASSKWIPADGDTPRLILTRKGCDVNAKESFSDHRLIDKFNWTQLKNR